MGSNRGKTCFDEKGIGPLDVPRFEYGSQI